jgi:hypothetical protein
MVWRGTRGRVIRQYADPDADRHKHSDGHPYADKHADTHGDADTHAHSDAD